MTLIVFPNKWGIKSKYRENGPKTWQGLFHRPFCVSLAADLASPGLPFSHPGLNLCWQLHFLFPVGVYATFKNSSVHDYLTVSLRFFLFFPHCSSFCPLQLKLPGQPFCDAWKSCLSVPTGLSVVGRSRTPRPTCVYH